MQQALAQFALAYASTGRALQASTLALSSTSGAALDADAILPCGLKPGSDLLVSSSTAPTTADAAAVAAAPAAVEGAGLVRQAPTSVVASGAQVYAKEGSAIAASQAKMGENSYYYSVGKNRGTPAPAVAPAKPVAVVSVAPDAKQLPEATITSYSMLDDDAKVKIHIPMAGAATLAEGAINCIFRDRSFDLRVAHEGKCHRLRVPILLEEINQHACSCRKRQGKLIVILEKRDESKQWCARRAACAMGAPHPHTSHPRQWSTLTTTLDRSRRRYELRKTKGIGDTEFNKIVPNGGEEALFTL